MVVSMLRPCLGWMLTQPVCWTAYYSIHLHLTLKCPLRTSLESLLVNTAIYDGIPVYSARKALVELLLAVSCLC